MRMPQALKAFSELRADDDKSSVSSNNSQSERYLTEVDESESYITRSEDSDDATSTSSKEDANVAMAFAKHQLIASLMQDVFTIFDAQWNRGPKEHAPSRATQRGKQSHQTPATSQASVGKGKRRTTDRDSPPPKDNGQKRRRANSRSSDPTDTGRKRLFACPFHQNNPSAYRANNSSGSDFRACAGPGFLTISRLK